MKKQIKSALFSGVFSLLSAIPAFAGTWQQNGPVWTYTKDDGTKATSEWIQYKEKWYHFETTLSCRPDGSNVTISFII